MATHLLTALDAAGRPIPGLRISHFHRFCIQRAIEDGAPWTCGVWDPLAGPPSATTDRDGNAMISLVSDPSHNHYFYAEYGGERLILNGTPLVTGGYRIEFHFAT